MNQNKSVNESKMQSTKTSPYTVHSVQLMFIMSAMLMAGNFKFPALSQTKSDPHRFMTSVTVISDYSMFKIGVSTLTALTFTLTVGLISIPEALGFTSCLWVWAA